MNLMFFCPHGQLPMSCLAKGLPLTHSQHALTREAPTGEALTGETHQGSILQRLIKKIKKLMTIKRSRTLHYLIDMYVDAECNIPWTQATLQINYWIFSVSKNIPNWKPTYQQKHNLIIQKCNEYKCWRLDLHGLQ